MSPTSDPEVEALLARAEMAHMATVEQQRWRHELDPLTLDTCGCKASAKAAAVAGVLVALIVLIAAGPGLTLVIATPVAILAAAVVGKVSGHLAADKQRTRLLSILQDRIDELIASAAPA